MIRKFISIENVGKLRSCKAAGDVELRQLSLIYAENGRGKTTICDIFRSLRSGDGSFIQGRTTLGPSAAPKAQVLLENSIAKFDGKAWNELVPELEIYDSRFVHENVYAGELVEHEQKRNLYRVIVGEKGVELATLVDKLDAEIREADKVIKSKKLAVDKFCPVGMSTEEFVALEEHSDIDARIDLKKSELETLRQSDEIARKRVLDELEIPNLPSNLPSVLGKELEDISSETEQLVRSHIENHTSGATEPWLDQGCNYLQNDECPFCQQSVDGNDLVSAYRVYFGEAYESLKDEVNSLRERVLRFGSESDRLRLDQSITSNEELIEFWKKFVDVELLNIDSKDIRFAMTALQHAAVEAVDKKVSRILEPVVLGGSFEAAALKYSQSQIDLGKYNQTVKKLNALIATKKGETSASSLSAAEVEFTRLQAAKERHGEKASAACSEHETALADKKKLEGEKSDAKAHLDEYSGELLGGFPRAYKPAFGNGHRRLSTHRDCPRVQGKKPRLHLSYVN